MYAIRSYYDEGLEKTQKLADVLSDFDPEAKLVYVDFKEELAKIKDELTEINRDKYTCVITSYSIHYTKLYDGW